MWVYTRYIDIYRERERKGVYRFLVGKPEGRRPLGRPRRRWVDNVRMDLQVVGCGYIYIYIEREREREREREIERGVYRVLLGKPEGRRPLGRPRRRWVDNVRMDLQGLGCGCIYIYIERERERERGCIGSCWGNRREGDHWGDLGVDGWIMLGWISTGWDVGIWTGLGWPRIETVGGRL